MATGESARPTERESAFLSKEKSRKQLVPGGRRTLATSGRRLRNLLRVTRTLICFQSLCVLRLKRADDMTSSKMGQHEFGRFSPAGFAAPLGHAFAFRLR